MSLHITAGSLGMAMAPLVFVPAVYILGARWSWLIAVPGLVALTYTLQLLRKVPLATNRTPGGWSPSPC